MAEIFTILFGALLVLASLLIVIAIWVDGMPVENDILSRRR